MKKNINVIEEDIGTATSSTTDTAKKTTIKPKKNKKKTQLPQKVEVAVVKVEEKPKTNTTENVEIYTKSIQISSLIDSWLSSSTLIDKYKEEDNEKTDLLKKYTEIRGSSSNDPNQNIHSKNNSPFYMLDNNNNSKNTKDTKKSQQQQKPKDLTSMTKNHLENILTNHNIVSTNSTNKKKNYLSAQNNNTSFRYQPYNKNSNNEDSESKSSLIKSSNKFKNNQQPQQNKKLGMWG